MKQRLVFLSDPNVSLVSLTFRNSARSNTSNLHFIPSDISTVCVSVCRLCCDVSVRLCSADVDNDVSSPRRCLADALLLLARQQVGADSLWLLPQTERRDGETLRQTAERALASLPGNHDIISSW